MQNNLPATKADLDKAVAKLATKEELAKLATRLDQTEEILRTEIRLTAEETKEEIREEIKQSSSKILNVLDSFLGEIKTSQEERIISSHQLSNHEDRITTLEKTAGLAVA